MIFNQMNTIDYHKNIIKDYLIDKTIDLDDETIKKQQKSFNNFIKNKLPKKILGYKEFKSDDEKNIIKVNVFNYTFIKPKYQLDNGTFITITPDIAKKYKLTYSINVHVDIKIFDKKPKVVNNMLIGNIPLMVGSCECDNGLAISYIDNIEYGGYFIVDGIEKILNNKEL